MALINYQDYLDFPALNAAIKELENNNKQFGTLTNDVFKGIKTNVDATTKSLKDNLSTLQNFNVNQRNAAQGISDIGKSTDQLITKQTQYQQVTKGLNTLSEQLAKNNIILNGTVEKIQKEFSALSDTEEKDIQRKKELITITNVIAGAVTKYNSTISGSINSYELLQKASKDAVANARNLAVEFGADSTYAIEAANAADLYAKKLAEVNSLIRNRPQAQQPIPFTTNLTEDGSVKQPSEGVTSGAVVTQAETQATQEQLAVQSELNAAKQQDVVITSEQGAAIAETTTFLDAYLGSLKQNLELQIENDVALAQNKAAQKELFTQIKANGVATDEQTAKLIQLRTEQIGLNAESKDLKGNIGLLSKEFISADGSIDELRVRLTGLTSTYEALSVAEKQSAFGAELKQQIDIMQPALLSAESELGKFQRNVGNYSNSIVKSFGSAFSFLRQIAYIIPGIGMAGIFNLIFQAISKVTTSLNLFGSATDETVKKVKSADEVIKEQVDDMDKFKESLNGVQASALATGLKLQAFVDIAKDSEQPLKVRNDALLEANKILGEHGEKLTLVNIATAAVTEEVNKFTQALIQQAVAAKYADQIADLIIKQTNQTKDYKKSVDDLSGAFVYNQKLVKQQGLSNVNTFDLANVDAYTKKVKDAATVLNTTTGQIESIQGDFNEATQQSISLFGDLGTKGKDGLDKLKKSLQDAYEIQKLFLEDQINDNKAIAGDANVLYTIRADAAQKVADLEIQLSQLTYEYDQKTKKNEILAEEQNALRIKQINIQLNNDLQKIFADRNKFPDAEIKAPVDNTAAELAAREKFNQDILKKIQEGGKAIQTTNQLNEQYELQANEELYDAGLIGREKYEKAKVDIAKKYQLIDLQIQLATQKAILTTQDATSNAAEETRLKIALLEGQIKSLGNSANDTSKDLAKVFANLYANLNAISNIAGNNVADFFSSLTKTLEDVAKNGKASLEDYANDAIALGYSVVDELNAADEARIANLEKNKDHELSLTQNNAAAQAAIQERYAKEEAKIKRKEALNNKISALFNIAINTAVAATKTLGETGIFGIPLLPLVIGLGAAEAAVVLAQPLPQYAKGTDYATEGFAVVDEKGSELIVDRHGRLKEVGSDSGPRITHLNEGDKVFTASRSDQLIKQIEENKIVHEMQLNSRLTSRIQEGKRNEAIHAMSTSLKTSGIFNEAIADRVEKAVKDIPIFQTIFDEKGIREREKRRNDLTQHRNTYNFSFKRSKN